MQRDEEEGGGVVYQSNEEENDDGKKKDPQKQQQQNCDDEDDSKLEHLRQEQAAITPRATSSSNNNNNGSILTWFHIRNVFFCFLAWACTISTLTLIVGTSNLVMEALVHSSSTKNTIVSSSSAPIGSIFIGSAIVSIKLSEYLFARYGTKKTFMIGSGCFGLIGGTVCCILSIYYIIPLLFVIGTLFFGMSNGIGFYIRFAVTELVPIQHKSKAVTLTISGGVIAAFVGPELAYLCTHYMNDTIPIQGTLLVPNHYHNQYEEPNWEYMSLFYITGILNFANVLLILAVQFPDRHDDDDAKKEKKKMDLQLSFSSSSCNNDVHQHQQCNKDGLEQQQKILVCRAVADPYLDNNNNKNGNASNSGIDSQVRYLDNDIEQEDSINKENHCSHPNHDVLQDNNNNNIVLLWYSLLKTPDFIIPMILSTIAWTNMALPMSVVRIVMADLKYTPINSLRVMEMHFVGMFGTGLISGVLLQKYGSVRIFVLGAIITVIAIILNSLVQDSVNSNGSIVLWIMGMFFSGVGWNFSFSAGTVCLTKLYMDDIYDDDEITHNVNSNIQNNNEETNTTTSICKHVLVSDHSENQQQQSCETMPYVTKKKCYTKSQVQSTNDCFMFLIAGCCVFCASYIYEAAGSEISGWRVLNYTVLGLVLSYCLILTGYCYSNSITNKQ